jgi:hypothetical protein
MPATVIHEGTDEIVEDISKFEYTEDASGVSCVRVWTGPWPEVLTRAPKRGMVWADIRYDPVVESTTCTRPAPGVGTVTVRARRDFSGDPDGNTISGEQPVYELDWEIHDLSLETHERFNGGEGKGFDGAAKLDPDAYPDLKPVKDGGKMEAGFYTTLECKLGELVQLMLNMSANDRAVVYAAMQSGGVEGAALVQEYFSMRAGGYQTYRCPVPVLTKTSTSGALATTTSAGRIETPSFPSVPKGWEFIGTADRSTRTGSHGKWRRVQTWEGAKAWDTRIYGGK